ncbi:MAG: nucleotidyl transferase AbiEii/AbiGii toxin family protein [Bacteroidia bacterium]|nr:nucleotidyl transferase AbiEii/AbiGii toxin family protein [Bacteroidia bacterium]
MSEEYYLNSLYPLQNKVLKVIEACNTLFYLTGGTALSRAYLNHRFSDDLDLFMNMSNTFTGSVTLIINKLSGCFKGGIETGVSADTFYRIIIKEKNVELKCDFVNDIEHYFGKHNSCNFFSKIDNPLNILSNKISALPRNNPKDIADILYLSYYYQFNWFEIVEDAKQKDLWVNPIDTSSIIESFPIDLFDSIIWITKPDYQKAEKDLKCIAKEILLGSDNSLYRKG